MGVVFLANTNDYMVTNHLMNKVTSKVVMTLMGYATDELDPKAVSYTHLDVYKRQTCSDSRSGTWDNTD